MVRFLTFRIERPICFCMKVNIISFIEIASQQKDFHLNRNDDSRFSYKIEYQPDLAQYDIKSWHEKKIDCIKDMILTFMQKHMGRSI